MKVMIKGKKNVEGMNLQKWVANFGYPRTPMALPDTSELLCLYHDGVVGGGSEKE